jgi:hypothetical protein
LFPMVNRVKYTIWIVTIMILKFVSRYDEFEALAPDFDL